MIWGMVEKNKAGKNNVFWRLGGKKTSYFNTGCVVYHVSSYSNGVIVITVDKRTLTLRRRRRIVSIGALVTSSAQKFFCGPPSRLTQTQMHWMLKLFFPGTPSSQKKYFWASHVPTGWKIVLWVCRGVLNFIYLKIEGYLTGNTRLGPYLGPKMSFKK